MPLNQLFNIHGENSKLIKAYMQSHTGQYPVYSGQVIINEPAGYIDDYDHEGQYIIWTTYGSSASLMKIVNGQFSIGRNAGGLSLKTPYKTKIDLEWFLYKYQPIFIENRGVDVDGQKRMPHSLVKDIQVQIPINDDGDIDIEFQINEKDRFKNMKNLQTKAKSIYEEINSINVEIIVEDKEQYKEVSLSNPEMFDLFIGKRVLKSQLIKSTGNIPLYSANVFKPFGFVEESNITDFGYNCVLWGIDGNFEFSVKQQGEIFATTDHCGVIRIKKPYILPEYLVYQLNLAKYKYGFDRSLRASLKNMNNIVINFPFTKEGEIDLNAQKLLTDKYKKCLKVQKEICTFLEQIYDNNIAF